MTGGRDPWSDPATPTQPGAPYAGPPQTAPTPPHGQNPYGQPPYGQPPYGQDPYGRPPYGYPVGPYGPGPYGGAVPWGGLPPRGPQRPGQVITAAVLAFVQGTLVLIASIYVWFFASIADFAARESGGVPQRVSALASEGAVLAMVGLASAVLLVAAGVLALNRRSRGVWLLLLAAHAVQVALAAYWAVRLYSALGDVPGAGGEGAFASFALLFAAGPLTALGLLLIGGGRAWFDSAQRTSATGAV
jgi:hypothetical protein